MRITVGKIPEDVRGMVVSAYNGFCACDDCYNKAMELHHVKSNSKLNNIRWKLFLQSPFNLVPICRGCHDSSKIYEFKITDKQADMYEQYLRGLTDESTRDV